MSISLKDKKPCSQSRSPMCQIWASASVSVFLDFAGVLWLKKDEASRPTKLLEDPADPITAFDLSPPHKSSAQLLAVGYQSGALELLSIGGTSQKKLRDAHKGSAVRVAFSPDAQTVLTAGEDCALRLWSRSGMLRSEIARTESPATEAS